MLHLFRILRISMRALTRNKMRTFLTALGIIIGIASVIAMVSIGSGPRAPSRTASTRWARTSSSSGPGASACRASGRASAAEAR